MSQPPKVKTIQDCILSNDVNTGIRAVDVDEAAKLFSHNITISRWNAKYTLIDHINGIRIQISEEQTADLIVKAKLHEVHSPVFSHAATFMTEVRLKMAQLEEMNEMINIYLVDPETNRIVYVPAGWCNKERLHDDDSNALVGCYFNDEIRQWLPLAKLAIMPQVSYEAAQAIDPKLFKHLDDLKRRNE